jgi:hypothetical protein
VTSFAVGILTASTTSAPRSTPSPEHLRDGLEPMPSTVTDHVALQLIIDRARTLPTEWPEVFRGRHLLLPEHPDDNVFDWLLDLHVDPRNLADGAR